MKLIFKIALGILLAPVLFYAIVIGAIALVALFAS